jgi:hypothetical protein
MLRLVLACTAVSVVFADERGATAARADEASKWRHLLAAREERHLRELDAMRLQHEKRHSRELEAMRLQHEAEVSVLKARYSPQLQLEWSQPEPDRAAASAIHKQARTARLYRGLAASRTLLKQNTKCAVDEFVPVLTLKTMEELTNYVLGLLPTNQGCFVCLVGTSGKQSADLISSALDCVEPSCDPSSGTMPAPVMVSFLLWPFACLSPSPSQPPV